MRVFITIVLAITIASCNFLEFYSKEEVVAEVNGYRLYKEDIRNLIPEGTSYSDSITMLRQYVNSWALKYLLLAKAQNELAKEEKNVEQEVEDFRNSLIAFRYEQLYLSTRLDTLVSEEEARDYYITNTHSIAHSNSIVKGRVIKISLFSPNIERIRSMYKATALEEIDELERICYNSADRYNNFNNEWTDLAVAVRELPIDLFHAESELVRNNSIESQDSLYSYFAFFPQVISPGETTPFEYSMPRIKEIIIGRRKQNLIRQMERELINEALQKNIIKTNINDYSQNENQH